MKQAIYELDLILIDKVIHRIQRINISAFLRSDIIWPPITGSCIEITIIIIVNDGLSFL